MVRSLVAVTMLAGAAVLAGCGTSGGPGSGGDDAGNTVPGRIGGDSVADAVRTPHGDVRLRMTLADGRLAFSGECNHFEADASWDDGTLVAGDIGGTEMGCPGPRQGQDEWLVRFFSARPRLHLDGDDVSARALGRTVWFVPYVDPGPAAPLVGTTWTLTGIAHYEGDMGSVGSVSDDVHLQIAEGRLTTDGLSASVVVDGDRLVLSDVSRTPGGLDPDTWAGLVAVLHEGSLAWTISGSELRIRSGTDPAEEVVFSAS